MHHPRCAAAESIFHLQTLHCASPFRCAPFLCTDVCARRRGESRSETASRARTQIDDAMGTNKGSLKPRRSEPNITRCVVARTFVCSTERSLVRGRLCACCVCVRLWWEHKTAIIIKPSPSQRYLIMRKAKGCFKPEKERERERPLCLVCVCIRRNKTPPPPVSRWVVIVGCCCHCGYLDLPKNVR